MIKYTISIFIFVTVTVRIYAEPMAQWCGPERDGVFPGTGLLKSWPEGGPELLWSIEDLDAGYSTPSVTHRVIHDGVLYIRHGQALMAYNIKA